jgi:hypothetical protein
VEVREQASETWTVAVAEEEGSPISCAETEEERASPVAKRTEQKDKHIIILHCLNIIPLFIYIIIA